MPLADDAGGVAGLRSIAARGPAGSMISAASPGRIPVPLRKGIAGEQRVARRRAGRGGGVRIGEPQPVPRQPIEFGVLMVSRRSRESP